MEWVDRTGDNAWEEGGKYHLEREGRLILVFNPAHKIVLALKMDEEKALANVA